MNVEHRTTPVATSGWKGFWNRGGWWRAALVAAAYIALYNLAGLALQPLLGGLVDTEDFLATPVSAFVSIGVQPLVGSVFLIAFAYSLGWVPRPIFGRQPVPRRWWFWVAPLLVLVPIVFHFIGIDYGRYAAGVVAAVLVAGVFVGFSEEFLTRGTIIVMLRRHGYREWAVMALSSLVFALLHLSNLFTGQDISTVGPTVVYAFAFGVCMYATLRVGGSLIWPIILHALTDPTTILVTGAIDDGTHATFSESAIVATAGTFAYIAWAVVLLIVTRGDAQGRADADETPFVRRAG